MALSYGNVFSKSGNFSILNTAPIDNRLVVDSKADLLRFDYPYVGLIVAIKGTKDIYVLTAPDCTVEANWKKIGGGGEQATTYTDAINLAYTNDPGTTVYVATSETIYTKADGTTITAAEYAALPTKPAEGAVEGTLYKEDVTVTTYEPGVYVVTEKGIPAAGENPGTPGKVAKLGTTDASAADLQTQVTANKAAAKTNADAITAMDEAYKAADTKINNKLGGIKLVPVTEGLDTNVKEQYKLVIGDETGAQTDITGSSPIKIYKDSSLVEVKLTTADATTTTSSSAKPTLTVDGEGKFLSFVYLNADGLYDVVSIDVSKYLSETEFKNGLAVSNGEVSVKIADASANYAESTEGGVGIKTKKIEDAKVGKAEVLYVDGDTIPEGKQVGDVKEAAVTEVTGLADAADVKGAIEKAVADASADNEAVSEELTEVETALKAVKVNGHSIVSESGEVLSGAEIQVVASEINAKAAVGNVGDSDYVEAKSVADVITDLENADKANKIVSASVTDNDTVNDYIQASIEPVSNNDASQGRKLDITVTYGKFSTPAVLYTYEDYKKLSGKSATTEAEFNALTAAEKTKTAAVAKTPGIAKVEDVETIITDNEKVTSAALNSLDARLDVIEGEGAGSIKKAVNDITGTDTDAAGTLTLNGLAASITDVKSTITGKTTDDAGTLTLNGLKNAITAANAQATVKDGDKILSQDANGISSSMSFEYNTTDKKIYLYGSAKDTDHKIGEVDCTAFIKDGMLSSVELVTEKPAVGTEGKAAQSGQFLKLTWNTDAAKDVVYLDVTTLVDIYTGTTDQITVTNNKIALDTKVVTSLGLADSAVQKVAVNGKTAAGTTGKPTEVSVTIDASDITAYEAVEGKDAQSVKDVLDTCPQVRISEDQIEALFTQLSASEAANATT